MPIYSYKCLNSKGHLIKGTFDTDSEKSLRSHLRKEGLFLQEAKEAKDKGTGLQKEIEISFLNKISIIDIAMITRQIATLLKASVPLTESLAAIADQLKADKKRKKLSLIIAHIKRSVNEGNSFANSLKEYPDAFTEFYVSMVRSGEAAGNLDEVLFSLAEFLDSQHKLKSKVKSAMTYPIIMVFITIGLVSLLMTSVVPNVVSVFEDSKQALPWNTQLLILMSDFLSENIFFLFIFLLVSYYLFKKWKKSASGKASWDKFVLKIPVVGELIRIIAISRFASTLGTMLKSGVPILQSLDIVKSVMGNHVLMKVIDTVEVAIREGESMATALTKSGEFPPLVTHMIAVGEKSGQLEAMLKNVSTVYQNEVENTLSRLTAILEPLMILIMAGIVAFVVFSILMPIMQMNNIAM
jgi:type II secretion system protein F